MHARVDPSPELLALAAAQSGVVTAAQSELFGLGRHSRSRLVHTGRWQRLEGPVYVVHPLPVDWPALAWAGVLLGGDRARLSGLAAAHLHGLTAEIPPSVEVLVPLSARNRCQPPWTFSREQPGLRSPRSPGEPPRTTLEDTVLDLSARADPAQVAGWVTQAVQTRRTTAARLLLALENRPRHPGRQLLTELLGDVGTGVQSPLELRYLRDVERPHGLPRGQRQHRSRHHHHRDVVYEEFCLVVELDGRLGHEGLGRFRDMARDNHATLAGESTLRYGMGDIAGSPCAVAWQVGTALRARGWRDGLRRCPHCVHVPDLDFA